MHPLDYDLSDTTPMDADACHEPLVDDVTGELEDRPDLHLPVNLDRGQRLVGDLLPRALETAGLALTGVASKVLSTA